MSILSHPRGGIQSRATNFAPLAMDIRRLLAYSLPPRYWPSWIALSVLWGVVHLPYRWQLVVGRAIGRLVYRLIPRRRHIAEVNLSLCFPALSPSERRTLLRRHFESVGMALFEAVLSWSASDQRLRPLSHVEGIENLHQALKAGRGAILLSGHFTTLELGGRLLALYTPIQFVYRRQGNPLFEAIIRRHRERRIEKVIPRDNIREMVRSLRHNKAVWFAPDQNYGLKYSVWAPFFGIPAATNAATSRIAKISGAQVIPCFTQRLPDGRGYKVILHPALKHFPSDDVEKDTRLINELIEAQVRQAPEQYFWLHRRFKDRPPGSPKFY